MFFFCFIYIFMSLNSKVQVSNYLICLYKYFFSLVYIFSKFWKKIQTRKGTFLTCDQHPVKIPSKMRALMHVSFACFYTVCNWTYAVCTCLCLAFLHNVTYLKFINILACTSVKWFGMVKFWHVLRLNDFWLGVAPFCSNN